MAHLSTQLVQQSGPQCHTIDFPNLHTNIVVAVVIVTKVVLPLVPGSNVSIFVRGASLLSCLEAFEGHQHPGGPLLDDLKGRHLDGAGRNAKNVKGCPPNRTRLAVAHPPVVLVMEGIH